MLFQLAIFSNFLFFLLTNSVIANYEISQAKCKEYAGKCKKKAIPLIVGGSAAEEKEFPHMALIGFGEEVDEMKWECGGSLISPKHVLSAAHCAESRELGAAKKVKFGLIYRDEIGDSVQERDIISVINHPEYKRPIKYHDIAIFVLDSPVEITEFVKPACLNTNPSLKNFVPNAIGFGKTKFTDDSGHQNLKKVDLPILENSVCQPFFASMRVSTLNKGGLIESQICAGVLEGGHDTCQGDSGGPLQIFLEDPICNYAIIGITSFGKFCGYAKSPAIYTNVYSYVPWIVETVWGK